MLRRKSIYYGFIALILVTIQYGLYDKSGDNRVIATMKEDPKEYYSEYDQDLSHNLEIVLIKY